MKKKIAIIANGWNNLSLAQAVKGIKQYTDSLNIDIFLFLSYAAYGQSEERINGENAIFGLSDYSDFDGVIIFSSMLNSLELAIQLGHQIVKTNPNVISVGEEIEGLDYIGIDNFKGMYEMVSHLIEKHNVKNPYFFAGPKVNVDSNERLKATISALKDHGFTFNQNQICYTDWEYIKSYNAAVDLTKKGTLPDAIICANDHIAIAASIALQREGYSISKDTIITGFDRISYADIVYPSITTVFQNYEKIGYITAEHLLNKINHTAKESRIIVDSEVVINQSCGCKNENTADVIRQQFCTHSYSREMENIYFQLHTTDIANVLFNCSTFAEFKHNLNQFFLNNHKFESDNYYLIIDSKTVKTLEEGAFTVEDSYSDVMTNVVSIQNGKIMNYGDFQRKEIIPGYKKQSKPMVYTICSLHYDFNLFGYVVISDAIEHMRDTSLNHYMMQMNYNLEKYRQNNYLDEMNKALLKISIKDSLTGLYNRLGMEQLGLPLFEQLKSNNKRIAIVFADINRMKYINDNFGHLQGDLAIRTISSAILSNLPKDWIAIRYGGDEFIAFGECSREKDVFTFIEHLQEDVKLQTASMHLVYPLSVSHGYIISDIKKSSTLADYVNEADSIMYQNKQKTYQKTK